MDSMRRLAASGLVACVSVVGPAPDATAGGGDAAATAPAVAVVDFRCADGSTVRVAWWPERAEVTVKGERWVLPVAPSASGARYSDGPREMWEHHGELRLTGAGPEPMTCRPSPAPAPAGDGRVGLANPASVNCVAQGGRSVPERRPEGGQYRICLFADNRQCEEWALFRGECPKGGLRVAGYATDAARYCAITGGRYRLTAQAGERRPEQGVCTLPDGRECDAEAYFGGACP